MMILKKMVIDSFRDIHNQEINFGENFTVIIGKNGTQKSTLLGMIAQPFSKPDQSKSLLNTYFETQFGDIFNFSLNSDDDQPGTHSYTLKFNDSNASQSDLKISSKKRPNKHCLVKIQNSDVPSQLLSITEQKKLTQTNINQRITYSDFKAAYDNNEIIKIRNAAIPNDQTFQNFEISPDYSYYIVELPIISDNDSSYIRFVTSPRNYKLPVLYLSMARMFPLGEVERESMEQSPLDEETKEALEWSKKVLGETRELQGSKITAEEFRNSKTPHHVKEHSPETSSVGQDTISQIMSAVYSFQILKDKLGEEYKGGLLLIDEIDAGVFPAAQLRLVKKLKELSNILNLQIICTTHSPFILKKMNKHDSINYLTRSENNQINIEHTVDTNTIFYDILDEFYPTIPKIPFLCEDSIAASFLKALAEHYKFLKDIDIVPLEKSFTLLNTLDKIDNDIIHQNIFVIDGDHGDVFDSNSNSTGLALPFKGMPPEQVLTEVFLDAPETAEIFDKGKKVTYRSQYEEIGSELPKKYKDFTKKLQKSDSDFVKDDFYKTFEFLLKNPSLLSEDQKKELEDFKNKAINFIEKLQKNYKKLFF